MADSVVETEKYHKLDSGLLVPYFVQQAGVDKLKTLELYPDDVWVVSYPKCGTTWTQQIVRLIRNNGVQDDVKVTDAVPWLEEEASKPDFEISVVTRPRAFKSHFPYDLFPCGPPHTTPCKYIYVARNPKDVAVSFYFHTKQVYYPDLGWEAFWKMYINGDIAFGNYFDHLLSWWPHTDDGNVLFLKYEDMKKDLAQAVSRIAAFMEVKLSDDVIAKIADLTGFEKMAKDSSANYSWSDNWQKENMPAPVFLRKGIVGDWRNFLTAEQSAQVDTIFAEKLKGAGLIFDYE